MSIQMELFKIIINEVADQQIIVLKEVDGERQFPIVIGSTEAFAIDRRLKGQPTPRPQTHELLSSVIELLDARLVIRRDGKTIEVDSRPSDAIALGVANNVPIFVADHVMDEVAG